ncbi:MAG: GNAT family N-acetyltransferase [Clostridiales bacterium]|nr:GNAT family N-acetyltransferase [Clostridiales bacterium]
MKKETVYQIFSKMPVLETSRLILRRMRPSDCSDMYEYASRSIVTRYLTWNPHKSREYTLQYLEYVSTRYRVGDFFDWAMVLRENKKMIGTCGFTRFDYYNNTAEIGYVLNPDYWGQGIATEAVCEILRFGFVELNLHRIEARYMKDNENSRRVMERCGFKYEGMLRSALYVRKSYEDVGICSILSDEFFDRYLNN